MSACQNCGTESDVLLGVTVYGGPDGPFDEDWCDDCIRAEAEGAEEDGFVRLGDLVSHMQGKAMDREFDIDGQAPKGARP